MGRGRGRQTATTHGESRLYLGPSALDPVAVTAASKEGTKPQPWSQCFMVASISEPQFTLWLLQANQLSNPSPSALISCKVTKAQGVSSGLILCLNKLSADPTGLPSAKTSLRPLTHSHRANDFFSGFKLANVFPLPTEV